MEVDPSAAALQALEKLDGVLTRLTATPMSYRTHYQHMALARTPGMEEDALDTAVTTFTSYLAASDDIWIPFLQKAAEAAMGEAATTEEALDVETLFERAEEDYLSIPILKAHLTYLFKQAERAIDSTATRPEDFPEHYATEAVSEKARVVAEKAGRHLRQSHEVWNVWMEWEEERLGAFSGSMRQERTGVLQEAYLTRLAVPHLDYLQTAQRYSTFVTAHLPPNAYEAALEEATKIRQDAIAVADERERYENSLTSLQSFSEYLMWESTPRRAPRRQKGRSQPKPQDIPPDPILVVALYERAIAEAASQRAAILGTISIDGTLQNEEALPAAEAWLGSFWDGLTSFLREHARNEELELQTLARATRSVPSNATILASHTRALDFYHDFEEDDPQVLTTRLLSVMRVYEEGVPLLDAAGVVAVAIARTAYVKRRVALDNDNGHQNVHGMVKEAITTVREKGGDDTLKLEKYLVSMYMELDQFDYGTAAVEVWESATKFYKNKHYAWTEYANYLTTYGDPQAARKVFKDAATPTRNMDYPQALWNAWMNYEERWGSVTQLEHAIARVRKMGEDLSKKAAQDAQRAAAIGYNSYNEITHVEAPPIAAVHDQDVAMAIDEPVEVPSHGGQKRKAEDEGSISHPLKKTKPDDVPLKRDRENSTVFVSGLWDGIKDEDLKSLFKDCGEIREVKITKLDQDAVASVELVDRENVPAALTKDKKRIQGHEVAVYLAWQSTLFITNFPEKADDAFIRDMFGKYGTIFSLRWPSKKFLNSRRFCYLQYTSTDCAQAALELRGRELEPGMAISVAISNPQRKKERTDAKISQREIYVAGLAKSTTQKELEGLFTDCGPIKAVRLPMDERGKAKGFGFVEFEDEASALTALGHNNREVKKRFIAVTMVDPRAPGRKEQPTTGLGKKADLASRSVRIRKIPPGTEEGLLQQAIEKVATGIKRVEIFQDLWEAVVEFETIADAGKLLLLTDGLQFNDVKLELHEEGAAPRPRPGPSSKAPAVATSTGTGPTAFVPRAAKQKPRVGLGFKGKSATPNGNQAMATNASNGSSSSQAGLSGPSKDQDAFRAMLEGKK